MKTEEKMPDPKMIHETFSLLIFVKLLEELAVIPYWHPIKRWKKAGEIAKYRRAHQRCCKWANEPI